MARILSLGTGSLASQLPLVTPHEIIGVKRSPMHSSGIDLHQFDLLQNQAEIQRLLQKIGPVDLVLFTATPGARLASHYQDTYCEIPKKVMAAMAQLGWRPYWLHVSSTGVFHHTSGEWVHENTQPAPQTSIAQILRQSELIVESSSFNASIVRLGGLYGQGRTHLLNALQSGRTIQREPWSYTNRIHRWDAVRAIAFLIERALEQKNLEQNTPQRHVKACPPVTDYFHAVDHDPAPLHEVAQYIAKLHSLPVPELLKVQGIQAVHSQNKRVGNRRLIEAGFQWCYPTYRQGLLS